MILDRKNRARYRALYDTDQPVVDQNQFVITVPWVQLNANYSWDVLEILHNKNSHKGFINLLQSRRTVALWDLAETFETYGWSAPSSSSDTIHPYGIPYYINFLNNGVTAGGFAGQTVRYSGGTTGTVVAGIDGAAYPKWNNYADVYTRVDNTLLRKLRAAVTTTRFKPSPIVKPLPGDDKVGSIIGLYCNRDVQIELMDLADKRDDNNTPGDLSGKVLHNFDGETYFNKMPIQYVPQLDGVTVQGTSTTQTPNPIYCIDWSKIQPVVHEDYWMVESKPMVDRGQHTTLTVYLDACHQNLCVNRRTAGFVLHNPIV